MLDLRPRRQRFFTTAFAIAPVVLSAVVFAALRRNFFLADDFVWLFEIVTHDFWDFVLRPFGGHLCGVRNLVFWGSFELFGPDPRGYFACMLLTHLVNVALLFRVVRLTSGSDALAAFGATIWGTCTLNEGTLGWYSVYGHALATSFFLLVACDCLRVARGSLVVSPRRVALWCALALGAMFCFGTGLAFAAVFPVFAMAVVPRVLESRDCRRLLCGLPGIVVLLYFANQWFYWASSADGGVPWIEKIAVAVHVADVLWMLCGLLLVGCRALLENAVTPGRDMAIAPSGILLAAELATGLVLVLLVAGSDRRREACGFGVVAVAAYAIIAMGRGFLAGLPVSTPRYQYLATAALAIFLCQGLAVLAARFLRGRRFALPGGAAIGSVWTGVAAISILSSPHAIDHHNRTATEVGWTINSIDRAILSAPKGSDVYLQNSRLASLGALAQSPDSFPGTAGLVAIYWRRPERLGRRVRFVSDSERQHRSLVSSERFKGFLVRSGEARAANACVIDWKRPAAAERCLAATS